MAQTYIFSKKNFVFLIFPFIFLGCTSQKSVLEKSQDSIPTMIQQPLPTEAEILTPSRNKLKTYLAISPEQQTRGLSRVQDKDFSDHEAMLFFYTEDSVKSFWMPDTYFDLDIFFSRLGGHGLKN